MRWLFRWAFRLLILLIVLVVAAVLLLDTIAREITESRLRRQTGLDVKIGRMQVGLWNPRFTLENLVIYNSAEFGGSPLIELPELHLEYDRNPLFNSHFHFKLIRLNLARLNVVEDLKGQKNLDVLGKRLKKSGDWLSDPAAGGMKTNDRAAFHNVDMLNLTLGRVTYTQMKTPGMVEELKLDVRNQIFPNIKSEADLQGVGMVLLLKSNTPLLGNEGKHWLELLGQSKKK